MDLSNEVHMQSLGIDRWVWVAVVIHVVLWFINVFAITALLINDVDTLPPARCERALEVYAQNR